MTWPFLYAVILFRSGSIIKTFFNFLNIFMYNYTMSALQKYYIRKQKVTVDILNDFDSVMEFLKLNKKDYVKKTHLRNIVQLLDIKHIIIGIK